MKGASLLARKGHPHLPRFACADRPTAALREELRPLHLLTPAGVGLGQGVFKNKHSGTIAKHRALGY